MEQQIKQRLVGAVVLVALGVIFLPMVLNGPAVSESGAIPGGIPPEPTPSAPPALTLTSAAPTVLPVEGTPRVAETPKSQSTPKPRTIAPPKSTPTAKPTPAKATPKPTPKTVAKATPKPTAKTTTSSPVAWSVQVGSFTEKSKAYGFRDRLRKAGYATYVVDPKNGARYFKVRVGPELEQSRARQVMERLKAKQKVKGFLVKHQ